MRSSFLCAVALLAVHGPAAAEVHLPAVFADHMVLQRGAKVPVWGAAAYGERVVVTFAGQEKHAAVDKATGRWMVYLDPLPPGGPHELVVRGNGTARRFADVLVGDVWLAGGQSNMTFAVKSAKDAEAELRRADLPRVRLFTAHHILATAPQTDCPGQWEVCGPRSAAGFSAVAFYFGRELHERTGVPIGLMSVNWGATSVQFWMSPAAVRSLGDDGYLARYRDEATQAGVPDPDLDALLRSRMRKLAEWGGGQKPAADARLEAPPEALGYFPSYKRMPCGGYNGMIAPVAPFALKGVIWYQGESNTNWPDQYARVFETLVADWRRAWDRPDLPFLTVQLANFKPQKPEPSDGGWARLREAQAKALRIPHTGMAVAIDVGEAAEIHPKNKQEVGRRLVLAARSVAYGEKGEYTGPTFAGMTPDEPAVRLKFAHTGGKLAAPGGKPTGFSVAGADKRFVWADATIDGDTVVVRSGRVPNPVAVRYAWADNPKCDLVGGDGLPAAPFRTDDWPADVPAARDRKAAAAGPDDPVVFMDSFTTPTLGPTWHARTGNWVVKDGAVVGQKVASDKHPAKLELKQPWHDGLLRFTFRPSAPGGLDLDLYQEATRVAVVRMRTESLSFGTYPKTGPSKAAVLGQTDAGFAAGVAHAVTVERRGQTVHVRSDNGLSLRVPDAGLGLGVTSGLFILRGDPDATVTLDDVTVRASR